MAEGAAFDIQPVADYYRFEAMFNVDFEKGFLYWRAPKKGRRLGKPLQTKNDQGYITVMVDYRNYRAHRIIWLLAYGHWPLFELDHLNGKRADNRLVNLRDVPHSINCMNSVRGVGGIY